MDKVSSNIFFLLLQVFYFKEKNATLPSIKCVLFSVPLGCVTFIVHFTFLVWKPINVKLTKCDMGSFLCASTKNQRTSFVQQFNIWNIKIYFPI